MSAKRDHFNVLVVCALPFELQATIDVLENQTDSQFVNMYDDLPQFNMMVCDKWNSKPLKVAMTAQPNMGGIVTQTYVSELGNHFSANVVVMTGICAGDENKYGNVEYGSVVIAKETTVVEGGKEKQGGGLETFARYRDIDKRLVGAISQLVAQGRSAEWLKYIPDSAKRPSPRYVRDLILKCVVDNPNIKKMELLQKVEKENLPGMQIMNYDQILDIMKKQENPWVRAEGRFHNEYVVTDVGEEYRQNEAGFLRDDVVIGIFDSMIAIRNVTLNLKDDIKKLKERSANRKIRGVDMESHFFMEQTAANFSVGDRPGLGIVMKGISDYGTPESKVDYYQVYAASTSAAFLRHLMTEKQHLFKTTDPVGVSVPQPISGGTRKPETRDVPIEELVATFDGDQIIDAVVGEGELLWSEIGQKLGFKDARVTSLTVTKPLNSSKLRALITAKQTQVGKESAIEQLLLASKDLGIYGGVVDELKKKAN